ncbi:protein MAIN-LIKE 1-like [Glycine max]|uniref:protein MAIN-LIKE 1-like n=1 Tax=Glycine max TaxID=3847 RepID=UPI0003DE9AB6|nr:protein MAIN-LIKE 1-like [Glycine max]|eukprot:XP_006605178.1 protein MAIN-LIKE 1-like [Glycine max]
MVRTRGLGRALGRVSGRGLGKEDRDDSDDAPQRRRPTAFACRQRVLITVADAEPVVPAAKADVAVTEADVVADEPMVEVDVHDTGANTAAYTGAQATVDEPKGFLGGLTDPSVLTKYVEHVAASVWTGEESPKLKLSSHGRKVHNLVDTSDQGLLSSFVERWHRETSSFHLPVGEVMITLDDVASLLHLPVVGDLYTFQPLHVDEAVLMLVDLLLVSPEATRADTGHCRGSYVRLS